MKAKFNGHKNRVKHPSEPRALEAGETFECTADYLARHQSYVNNGALEEVKAAPKRKAKPKKADK